MHSSVNCKLQGIFVFLFGKVGGDLTPCIPYEAGQARLGWHTELQSN